MKLTQYLLFCLVWAALSCADSSGNDDDDTTAPNDDDTVADDDDTANDDDTVTDDDDTGPPPDYWDPDTYIGSGRLDPIRGWTPTKGVIHLHSIYSHDACDGDGFFEDGTPNTECLDQMREALCTTKMDYAMQTDHPGNMQEFDFEQLFHYRPGDRWIRDEQNRPLANAIPCEDGHEVLLTVGWESRLMPVGLKQHAAETVEERRNLYGGDGPQTIEAIRAAGGLVGIPHSEERTLEKLRSIRPDLMEIYQLHSNIDPGIREEYLGLDGFAFLTDAFPFLLQEGEDLPDPDLVFLSFYLPNEPSLTKWETIINEEHVTGTAACDAHRNALPNLMSDNERVDSYRRMMRWFSNVLLVDDPGDPEELKEALDAGRNFMIFEIFGVPNGFDFYADDGGAEVEMGGTVAPGSTLHAPVPWMIDLDPELPRPEILLRLYHIAMDGTRTLLEESSEPIDRLIDEPGAYRLEVAIVPEHLTRWLGTETGVIGDFVWIYTNPIYLR